MNLLPSKLDFTQLWNRSRGRSHYHQETLIRVQFHMNPGGGSFHLRCLREAMMSGKKCPRITIEFDDRRADRGFNQMCQLLEECEYNLRTLHTRLKALDWKLDKWETSIPIQDGALIFHLSYEESIRTFSPFAKAHPLKEAPKKWTMGHAKAALFAGQFQNLNCRMKLSDDYAHDAAANFGKGEISRHADFLERITESPSGWWVNVKGNVIGLNCHSFDYNEFTFDPEARVPIHPDLDPMRIKPFRAGAAVAAPDPATPKKKPTRRAKAEKTAEPTPPPPVTAKSPGILGAAFSVPVATFAVLSGTAGDLATGQKRKDEFLAWLQRAASAPYADWRAAWREFDSRSSPTAQPTAPARPADPPTNKIVEFPQPSPRPVAQPAPLPPSTSTIQIVRL